MNEEKIEELNKKLWGMLDILPYYIDSLDEGEKYDMMSSLENIRAELIREREVDDAPQKQKQFAVYVSADTFFRLGNIRRKGKIHDYKVEDDDAVMKFLLSLASLEVD